MPELEYTGEPKALIGGCGRVGKLSAEVLTRCKNPSTRTMSDFDVGMLRVAVGDRLVGIVTPRDMAVRSTSRGKGPDTLIRDIMSSDVIYCFEDQDTAVVACSIARQQIRNVPVVNRDRLLVGALSLGDLAPRCCQSGERAVGGHTQDQRRA